MPCYLLRTGSYTRISPKRHDLVETMRGTLLWMFSRPLCSTCFRYIHALHSYLLSFMRRTQPLLDVDSKQTTAMEEFEKKWEAGELEGWADATQKAQVDGSVDGIWCT